MAKGSVMFTQTQPSSQADMSQMLHPSYQLNPGDMFSVTPKVVLEATGAPKLHVGNENQINKLKERAEKELKELRSNLSKASQEAKEAAEFAEAEEDADADENEAIAKDDGLSDAEKAGKKILRDMRKEIQAKLKEKQDLSNKQKRMLRELRTDIPRMMSKRQFAPEDLSLAQQRFTEANSSALAADVSEDTSISTGSAGTPSNEELKSSTQKLHSLRLQIRYLIERWREFDLPSGPRRMLRLQHVMTQMMLLDPTLLRTRYVDVVEEKVAKIASEHGAKLKDVTKKANEAYQTSEWTALNPYDSSILLMDDASSVPAAPETPDAPFQGGIAETAMLRLTEPWRPREYMSAFAFIPRYLEVNQNICSAVYLRHPVARPGLAEVPTPFPEPLSQLAFNWFLRRR